MQDLILAKKDVKISNKKTQLQDLDITNKNNFY